MDHFERQLARMMRATEERTSFEPRHQERLRAGVRARRLTRAVQLTTGSALAVTGLGIGLFLLPGTPDRVEPSAPRPLPATSPSPVPRTTPSITTPPPSTPGSPATGSSDPAPGGGASGTADAATTPPASAGAPETFPAGAETSPAGAGTSTSAPPIAGPAG
ncbi:cellulase [Streptomyces sp. TRM49041]|uniref:cellulase n=1 Tax=Streptomyces sp. TRM49041 TaxID=2603216 RepID=UPI0011F016BD|nr:cellulase [Streptomyces sp. TRM49041]